MQIQLVKFNICQSSRPRVSYSTQCTSVLPCDVFQALSFAQTLYCFRSLISGAGIQTSKIIWVCLKMGPLPPIYGNLHRDNMFIHSGMNQSYPIYNWFSSRTYLYLFHEFKSSIGFSGNWGTPWKPSKHIPVLAQSSVSLALQKRVIELRQAALM